MPPPDKLSYLAGIIDGEGCFTAYWDKQGERGKQRDGLRTRITVANTNYDLMVWLKKNYGGFIYTRKKMNNPNWKIGHQWILGINRESGELIDSLIPILIAKKEQAKIIRTFIDDISTQGHKTNDIVKKKRKYIYHRMKELNLKGTGFND